MRLLTSESPAADVRAGALGRARAGLYYVVLLALLAPGIYEGVRQYRETQYMRAVALEATRESAPGDARALIVALRDYVRRQVRHEEHYISRDDRPFLRASAADTLRSGKGDCGEATRVFINLAGAMGVRAQRLYLEGQQPHVVAEVRLGDTDVLVDSYDAPFVPELATLEQVLRRPEFDHYSSLNWRRLLLGLPSFKINLGPLAYLLENPHALTALLWFALASVWASLRFVRLPGAHRLLRRKGEGLHHEHRVSRTLRPAVRSGQKAKD
ncbi:MAG TPA: transglutaminase domain-containing protein [Pyrinomonadaceae bacterium]